jgi:tryptophan 2,3-dioxygenase
MCAFASTLSRRRRTHHGIAVRILEDRAATGYTEGFPYLGAVRTILVFRSVSC